MNAIKNVRAKIMQKDVKMLTLRQLDAILDRLYRKTTKAPKDEENIKLFEQMYQEVTKKEDEKK